MGKMTGFLEFERQPEVYDPVEQRLRDYREFVHALSDEAAKVQGARCMDCGIPFCTKSSGIDGFDLLLRVLLGTGIGSSLVKFPIHNC